LRSSLKSWAAGDGEERARKIVDRSPRVLGSGDVLGMFGELTDIMGGDEERAREIVEQSSRVLGSGDVVGTFGELTEIMGGDEERARKVVDRSSIKRAGER
jgi:hypothetical protein